MLLNEEFQRLGRPSEVQINLGNIWDEGSETGGLDPRWHIDVGPSAIQNSLEAQLDLELRWMRFLGKTSTLQRWSRACVLRLGRWRRRLQPPDSVTLRRLLNIELSHLDLLRAGIKSGAPWIVVLEDDAACSQVEDLARGLIGISEQDHGEVAYVNLSQSFALSTLRVNHLLNVSLLRWVGSQPRAILQANRPITNTVCAIAYSKTFAEALLEVWDRLPVNPVVPVDWRLNEALMVMDAQGLFTNAPGGVGSCLTIEPPPILQMSMQMNAAT